MAPVVDTLTEAHAAVYDRQLRVWGMEVQRRLMDAKVLIIGLGGLSAEIAKNIVLAGVGTVALRDDTPATSAAPGNFLVEPEAASGRSVAEACAGTLQAMNPLMAVRVEPGPPSAAALLQGGREGEGAEAMASLVSRYDLVVACGLPLRQVAALDALCRQLGKQLFAGSVRGVSSFVFVDLGPKHTYTVKGETAEKVVEFSSFRDAMAADLSPINKRTHPLYLVLRACWEFEEAHSRPAAGQGDVAAVQNVAARLATATAAGKAAPSGGSAAQVLLPDRLLEDFVLEGAAESGAVGAADGAIGELAPVSAIVGGVVANNVLRALSHVGLPLRNLFCYSCNALYGLGVEECFV